MNKNLTFIRYLKPKNIKDRYIYLKWYNFIEKSQWWPYEKLRKYQWEKLKLLLQEAYDFVPYYRELFTKIGAKPVDINTFEDFQIIPFLTKDIVRERAKDLVSKRIKDKSKLKYYTTGGSTGQPLGFYKLSSDAVSRAFMHQQWKRVGYSENSRRVILRGEPIGGEGLFRKYKFSNDWLMSSYDLSEDRIIEYVNYLNKVKPEFFHVYPSSFYIFTRLMLDAGLSLTFNPKAILCGSESVRSFQRDLFSNTYKTRVYSWLGLSEGVIMAGECEYSDHYHAWPQYGFNEIVDMKNQEIQKIGDSGEIVGTALTNYVFPFIRYKTGDVGEYYGIKCSLCGREFPLLRKIDRWLQEIIVSKKGKYVSVTGLNPHSKIFDNVIQFQFHQKKQGELILKINKKLSFTANDAEGILTELRRKIGNDFEIKLVFVNEIPRTESGKHRYLNQELNLNILNDN